MMKFILNDAQTMQMFCLMYHWLVLHNIKAVQHVVPHVSHVVVD